MNLSEIASNKHLTTEDRCIRYLEAMRWPDGVACPQCGNKSISSFQTTGKSGKVRHLYQCLEKSCRYQFSPTTGTIFHDSHLPLSRWFHAVVLVAESEQPMSANQLRLALGVQYKTAAHVLSRIRQAMENGSIELAEIHLSPAPAAGEMHHRKAPRSAVQPIHRAASAASLRAHRSETAALLGQIKQSDSSVSPTAIDNVLSMFVSLAQISVKPPLFFVSYLKDKVFT